MAWKQRAGLIMMAPVMAGLVMAGLVMAGVAKADPPYPAALAAAVELYAAATVTMTQTSGDTIHVMLQSPDKPNKVIAFYRKALKSNGWTLSMDEPTSDAEILQAGKGEQIINVSATGGSSAGHNGITTINLILAVNR
jgi:hypothetical protein